MSTRRPPAPDGRPVAVKRLSLRAFAGTYLLLGLLALAVASVALGTGLAVDLPISPAVIVLVGLVPLLAFIVYTLIVRATTEYRLYEDALEIESGILTKDIDNLQLFRVRDLGFRQSLTARMLGIGDVTITSTDRSMPQVVVRGVTSPREVYDTVRRLVSASQAMRRTMVVEDDMPPSR